MRLIHCVRRILMLGAMMVGAMMVGGFGVGVPNSSLFGQEDMIVEEGPLIDQQPFDLIHLTAQAGGGSYKVFPIAFPNRQVPSNPSASSKVEVVLVQFPDRRYTIAWRWVERIELFEDMVLSHAKELLGKKDFIGAFQNLSYLMRNYPQTPRLEDLRREFLFSSLAVSFRSQQLEQTLSALEELKRSAPDYRKDDVARGLNNVAKSLLERFEEKGDYDSVKKLLERFKRSHGSMEAVQQAEVRLQRLLQSMQQEAESLFKEQRYREAYKATYACLSLAPGSRRCQEMLKSLNAAHSMVRVGVMQLSPTPDATHLIDWGSRRSGLLVSQPLFQFLQTGNEGGNYAFALGRHRLSDDRQSLMLSLSARESQAWNVMRVSQLISERANPRHQHYDPLWASIFDSIQTRGSSQLEVRLQRPNVLPHALMQWSISDTSDDLGGLPGPYQRTHFDGREAVYALRPEWRSSGMPVEVVEVLYETAQPAIYDLSRGYIDMIDQVFPADARSLTADARYQVKSFSLPSTHLLIPVSEHAYLSREKFRRALLYAADRENILKDELLGSSDQRDGRVVSGPFPLGTGDTDPLAYAYNQEVHPVAYDAQLAKLLLTIVSQEMQRESQQTGSQPPPLEKLVIGCPNFEFAKIAVQALMQQWAVIGLESEMRVLNFEDLSDSVAQCDLLYVTTTLWEPAADIQRLFGGHGVTHSDNPFVVQGLGRVREAKNWREVRIALQELHRVVAYHLPVLPLWQVNDRFVVRRGIQGVQDRSVSLYQDISKWRLPGASSVDN